VQDAGGVALLSYVPAPYDGKIVFIKAEKTQAVFPTDPANVWARVGRAFELHGAPGDHTSMIHSHADRLASCISARLTRADVRETANAR
jgi:surfactin synthase thioesterase subunit